MAFNVQKCLLDTQIFTNLRTVGGGGGGGDTPFPRLVASLPRSVGPLLKNPGYASDHIVYVCSLHFPLS